ncbi:MAG TPA: VTT domain-containing protein [Trueperaceae bacterium]
MGPVQLMLDALTAFINGAGLLAPLYYILSYVVTALLPVVPTPLVAALGGSAFGLVPAVLYGIIGLGLGAVISLTLARGVGRPLLRRLVRPSVLESWESLLGIRSVYVWGLIFLIFNLDFAVMVSGLSTLSLRQLWIAAMVTRLPWVIASAWLGDEVLVSDSNALLLALLLIPAIYLLGRWRPRIQAWLLHLQRNNAAAGTAQPASQIAEARIEDISDRVAEQVEAHH